MSYVRHLCLSAAVLGIASIASAATTIYSWENAPETWVETSAGNPAVSTFSNALGVTNGSYSLFTTGKTGYATFARAATYGNAGGIKALLAPQGGLITVDVTIPADSYVAPASGQYLEALLVKNGDGFYNQAFVGVTPDGLPHTVSVPVTSAEMTASTGYFEFIIGVNTNHTLGQGNGAVYYDNVTFTPGPIPEPATASLVLVGLGALSRRRRG